MACGRNVWNRILATKGILPILLGVYRIFGQRDINATPIDMNDVIDFPYPLVKANDIFVWMKICLIVIYVISQLT